MQAYGMLYTTPEHLYTSALKPDPHTDMLRGVLTNIADKQHLSELQKNTAWCFTVLTQIKTRNRTTHC